MSSRFIISYILFIVVVSVGFWFAGNTLAPIGSQATISQFKITSGESVFSIAQNLRKQNLISSRTIFVTYSIFSGSYNDFKPGIYGLKTPLSVKSLIAILTSGPQDVSVVIIPGMTLKEIDKTLSDNGICEKGSIESFNPTIIKSTYSFLEGVKNLEGFLMPDTYRFQPGSDTVQVISIILENFSKKLNDSKISPKNIYKAVITASLIEKEVITKEDKKLVAGIIQKRISIGMPLQIDASVIYAVCNGTFLLCDKELGKKDFSFDSPYNTYLYKGLPPAPISNPTLDSISAAINPQKSNYLYYLSDPKTSKTIFSATLEEHSKNRAKYLGL